MTDAAIRGACQWCERVIDPTIYARTIIQEVADEHRLPAEDIYAGDRHRHVVAARACAIRRIRAETKLTLKAIGDLLHLDHQSVIYHLRDNRAGARAAATSGGVRR